MMSVTSVRKTLDQKSYYTGQYDMLCLLDRFLDIQQGVLGDDESIIVQAAKAELEAVRRMLNKELVDVVSKYQKVVGDYTIKP